MRSGCSCSSLSSFALGFVGFGVGAGGVGFGDVIRDAGGGSGAPSISDAEKRVLDNPKDAAGVQGPLDRAAGRRKHGRGDRGARRATSELRPKDTDALRELAALYLQQARAAQQRAQIYQVRSDYLAPGSVRDTIFQLGGQPAHCPIPSRMP